MRPPRSYTALEDLGRVRLSRHFHVRDFLYSEIYGRPNIPDDPDLAIAAGRRLCEDLLDPMVETFGPIAVRSSFRSAELNNFGAAEVRPQECASNEGNFTGHIWDRRDGEGRMGATACIVIPWFACQYERGRDWRDLAWWVHDHLPYSAMYFFPRLAAFNLTWREDPARTISSDVQPKGKLLRAGEVPTEPAERRGARYADFPSFRGIACPAVPVPEAAQTLAQADQPRPS